MRQKSRRRGALGCLPAALGSVADVVGDVAADPASRFGITYSTTCTHPYFLARHLNSLGHVSGGRIAFNVITFARRSDHADCGYDGLVEHGEHHDPVELFIDALIASIMSTSNPTDLSLIQRLEWRSPRPSPGQLALVDQGQRPRLRCGPRKRRRNRRQEQAEGAQQHTCLAKATVKR